MFRILFAVLCIALLSCSSRKAPPRPSIPVKQAKPETLKGGGQDEEAPTESKSQTSSPAESEDSDRSESPEMKLPSTLVDGPFVSSFIDQIAGNEAAGRMTGSAQNRMVAEMIATEFKKAGLQPGGTNQTYFQDFTANLPQAPMDSQNIIGVFPGKGKASEVIIVGAHMDHLGVSNGETYYGADDNASGTTALVSAAHALGKVKDQLQRTVIFIAFSGEEWGLLGSKFYVKNPTVPLSQIKFMINMDMVGYSNGKLDAIGFAKTLEADRIVQELINKTGLTANYYATAGGGSDHMPFEAMNIPTGTFHTGLHENYHKPTDTIEKIDRIHLATISGLAADLALSLAQSPKIMLRSLAMEPVVNYGFAAPLHSAGCAPAFVSFEELQRSLGEL